LGSDQETGQFALTSPKVSFVALGYEGSLYINFGASMTTRSTVKKPSTAAKASTTTASKPQVPAKPAESKPVIQEEAVTQLRSRRVWPD
jgi:hypothetical protein